MLFSLIWDCVEQFLALPAAKLLLLAGTDRLDKPLMIGQMQVLIGQHCYSGSEDDSLRSKFSAESWLKSICGTKNSR